MAEGETIRIDQCLFGYADGHRLLKSSIKLPAEIASDLTAASDLAPGARFVASQGYWTGFPIPKLARYGVMQTWQAPEMPRPGSVWTHLLLFNPTLFEIVDELANLATFMRRPSGSNDHVAYAQPIVVPAAELRKLDAPLLDPPSFFHRARSVELLRVLYGNQEGPVRVAGPGELDELVIALWSQQWPRLRRNFRFQTAASSSAESSSKRFDIQFRLESEHARTAISSKPKVENWLSVAADDLEPGSRRALRAFLRRYGQDVKRQRGSFRPLAQLFSLSEEKAAPGKLDVPVAIARWFPDPDDALTLKRDLVDGAVFHDWQVDALLFLYLGEGHRSLPTPNESGLEAFACHWPARSTEMMRLAEWAANQDGMVAESILSTVARSIRKPDFWAATEGFPEMRRRMVGTQPDLLDSEQVGALDAVTLLDLVGVVPAGHDVGAALVRRLRPTVDERLVADIVARFPGAGIEAIEVANAFGVDRVQSWLRALSSVPSSVLDPDVMGRIRRTSILLAFADAFGSLSEDVRLKGSSPWAAALANAQDDLTQLERDRLDAFLFVVAATTGGTKAQNLLEHSFPYLHDRIVHSYLSWPAQKILSQTLPKVGFWEEWDDALKLRLAVSHAYVQHELEPSSFKRLIRRRSDSKMLRDAVEEISGGEKYRDVLRT